LLSKSASFASPFLPICHIVRRYAQNIFNWLDLGSIAAVYVGAFLYEPHHFAHRNRPFLNLIERSLSRYAGIVSTTSENLNTKSLVNFARLGDASFIENFYDKLSSIQALRDSYFIISSINVIVRFPLTCLYKMALDFICL
jgi:hypothetical protein